MIYSCFGSFCPHGSFIDLNLRVNNIAYSFCRQDVLLSRQYVPPRLAQALSYTLLYSGLR